MMLISVSVDVLAVASQGSVLVLFFEDENILWLIVTELYISPVVDTLVLA